jgi:hypothetical protein
MASGRKDLIRSPANLAFMVLFGTLVLHSQAAQSDKPSRIKRGPGAGSSRWKGLGATSSLVTMDNLS